MEIYQKIKQKLNEFGISENLSMEEFIDIVSNIYHKHESLKYDSRQKSLLDSIGSWNIALSFLNEKLADANNLSIIDFGCGTGFATKLLINSELASKCKTIYCYDLSPDMLLKCKQNLSFAEGKFSIEYISDKNELAKILREIKLDLFVTNSLLHHIPIPEKLISFIFNSLKNNGYYICGHEPNNSFYHNKKLTTTTSLFRIFKRAFNKLKKLKSQDSIKDEINVILETNNELLSLGLIKKRLPANFLAKLIDIHVPYKNNINQCWGMIGFSKSFLTQANKKEAAELVFYNSYSHIKDPLCNQFYFWKSIKNYLARRYPDDGADFLAIIKKTSNP